MVPKFLETPNTSYLNTITVGSYFITFYSNTGYYSFNKYKYYFNIGTILVNKYNKKDNVYFKNDSLMVDWKVKLPLFVSFHKNGLIQIIDLTKYCIITQHTFQNDEIINNVKCLLLSENRYNLSSYLYLCIELF